MNVALFHPSPSAGAGSEITMLLSVRALLSQGIRFHLVTAEPTPTENPESTLVSRELFRHSSTPAQLKRAKEALGAWLTSRDIALAHFHLFPHPSVMRFVGRHCARVATAHVPVCPNGARFNWAQDAACNREIGLRCLSHGYTKLGCGHTGDGKQMSTAGFVRAIARDTASRKALATFDRVICPSEWMRERLLADGLAPSKLEVVPPPMAPIAASADPIPRNKHEILYVGRLARFKGVHLLIEALARLPSEAHLTIAGDGPAKMDLIRCVKQLDLEARVTFLGHQTDLQLWQLRRRARVGVMPSLWNEVYGMSGQEGLLAGLPMIASNVGGISEWCKREAGGLLVTPGDVNDLANALRGKLFGENVEDDYPPSLLLGPGAPVIDHASRLMAIYEACAQSWVSGSSSRK